MQEKLIHSDLCWHCPVSYDSIGNRLTSFDNFGTATYAANCLNLYTAVNPTIDQLVLRSLNEGVSEQLVLRSFSEGGSNNLTYDADGNLLLDDRFTYSYDDENRLVSVTPLSPYPFNAVVNAYDHRNRRIRKDVWGYHEGDWRYQETHTFVWDGWNVVLEQISYEDQILHTIEYFWGNDVSGTEEGAGGVGGLLATRIDGVFYIPVYGGNGNIMMYVDASGEIVAQYDYDPYGNTISRPPTEANIWNLGFSTKYYDREVNLIAYQLRTYNPVHGRWLNRDPVEESGGENLYGYCHNNAIECIDVLGGSYKTLADIERNYRDMITTARSQGKNVAAGNLEHFLSASGNKRILDWNWLRLDASVLSAEKLNQKRLEKKLIDKARTLTDGQRIAFYDYFDSSKTASIFSELYYASGTYTVSSYGDFILIRNGCVVEIVGTVDHRWWDDYDWHAGLSAFVPGFGNVEDADAQRLENAGMAKSFRMESEWTQTVRGKYTIRKFWRNKSSFSWDLPVRGNTGIYAKHKRSKTTALGTGLGGRR